MNARALVAAIDRGPCHARAVRSLSRGQRRLARMLACRCAHGAACRCGAPIRLMPRRGRWPLRYVVLASGSYLLGTFDSCSRDFDAEVMRARLAARKGGSAA